MIWNKQTNLGNAWKVRETVSEIKMDSPYRILDSEFYNFTICNIFRFQCHCGDRIDSNFNSFLWIPTNLNQTRVSGISKLTGGQYSAHLEIIEGLMHQNFLPFSIKHIALKFEIIKLAFYISITMISTKWKHLSLYWFLIMLLSHFYLVMILIYILWGTGLKLSCGLWTEENIPKNHFYGMVSAHRQT